MIDGQSPFGVQQSSVNQQTGWRLPRAIIEQVNRLAEQEGISPGAFAAQLLEVELTRRAKPLTAAELAKQIKLPPHLFHG
jgi:hypothetical protein